MQQALSRGPPGAAVLITRHDHTGAEEELGFYCESEKHQKSKRERSPPPRVVVWGFLIPTGTAHPLR